MVFVVHLFVSWLENAIFKLPFKMTTINNSMRRYLKGKVQIKSIRTWLSADGKYFSIVVGACLSNINVSSIWFKSNEHLNLVYFHFISLRFMLVLPLFSLNEKNVYLGYRMVYFFFVFLLSFFFLFLCKWCLRMFYICMPHLFLFNQIRHTALHSNARKEN